MKYINNADILSYEKQYRANLINCLSGFKGAHLVGTADGNGFSNLAIFSNVFHLGANPPLIGLINRPDSVNRGTLENIKKTGVYTLCNVTEAMKSGAHQTSARYAHEESEFGACGFTEEWLEGFAAPFVKESTLKIGLELREIHNLAINGTHLVIGEVKHLWLDEQYLSADGFYDHAAAGSIATVGLDAYHTVNSPTRFEYAKTDKPTTVLK